MASAALDSASMRKIRTGATRLYERAGMRVAYAAVAFEKELS